MPKPLFTIGKVESGVLDADAKVAGKVIKVRAKNVRITDTGAHAQVAILVGPVAIQSDVLNVERDSERHNFANALYGTRARDGKFGDDIVKEMPQDVFEQEFLLWSRALWPAWIGASSGEFVKGDESPSAPPWAVPGLIMEGSTNIWAGDAGANKSTLMRLACQSLTYGVHRVIPVRGEERGIWVNAEESPAEHTRQLGNVNAALGLPRTAEMYTLHARGMRIQDLAQRLEKAVRETKAKHVFIDSLSRLAQGMSLNDNNTATLLVDSVSGLGCSVNWIGHTGHMNRDRLAGSKHFENAARVMVLVESRISIGGLTPERTRGVRARVYKANGAVQTSPMFWTLTYHPQFGLQTAEMSDEDTWPVLNCTVMYGEKQTLCRRKTWTGVQPTGEVFCARHQHEDGDA